ncbi:MAG: spermidine synthase [Planctomycetota bacterium]
MSGLRVTSVLFFLSGATALVYEVIWFKRFAHVWGSSTLAVAVVVASFLGGLALGAAWAGHRAGRIRRPLLWYAGIEFAIGVVVLLLPYPTTLLRDLAAGLYPLVADAPAVHALVQAVLTFLALGPPTALMGATLPILVRRFDRVGWLYGVNTAGAAVGCFAAGFFLLPNLGLVTTNLFTALTNFGLGAVALLLARRLPPLPPPADKPAPAPRAVLAAAALAGGAALVLQVVWNRQLAVMLGGSVYAFSAVLFMVLLGIGCGAVAFHFLRPRRLGPIVLLLLVTTVLGRLTLEPLTRVVGELRDLRAQASFNALLSVGVGGIVQFLPSFAMGVLFPALVARTDGRVGGVYAWNTLGAIAGALVATLLLVPALGVAGATACALGLYLLMLVVVEPRPRFVLPGLLLLLPALLKTDPLVTDVGMFLSGAPRTGSEHEVLFFEEGAQSNVLVRENLETGARTLHVNGKPDASNTGDMATQLGLAYFPRLLRPQADEVLVIGYGSGTTAGASLLFPETRVTCCEIEPAVYRAGKTFADVNHDPPQSPRFHIVLNDGRHHLRGEKKRYDLIISEPSNPWLAGQADLFTREFYATARARLAERGLLAQWVQTYALSPEGFRLIVRTISSVFDHVALVRVCRGDTILLAATTPLLPTQEDLDAAQGLAFHGADDLERHYGTSDVAALLLEHVLLDGAAVRDLVGGGELNTDSNLRLEFEAPHDLFDREANVDHLLLGAVDGAWQRRALGRWGATPAGLAALRRLIRTLAAEDQVASARRVTEAVLARHQVDPWFQATRILYQTHANTFAFRSEIVKLVEVSPEETLRVGIELAGVDDHLHAVEVFRVLSAVQPTSAEIWARLALSERAAGTNARADAALARALRLDPFNETVRRIHEEWD